MKTEAIVINIKETTRHVVDGQDVTSTIKKIAIEEQCGAFYLFRLDHSGECVADTLHLTLDEAREQAEMEYDLNWE